MGKQYSPKCPVDDVVYRMGLCVSGTHAYYYEPEEQIEKRLEYYKQLGFTAMRVETGWAEVEPEEGKIIVPRQHTVFRKAKEAGLRIKMALHTAALVPNWYFQKHPGSLMVNQNGKAALITPSYFAPGLRGHLTEALDNMMAYLQREGIMDSIDALVVDGGGPGGECAYPSGWTQSPGGFDNTTEADYFWGYDACSQQNFRETMQKKYGTIAAANAAWDKDFSGFDEVEVPHPGKGDAFWEDYLIWYRDSKRAFMVEQVQMFQAAVDKYTGGRIRLIVYLPGYDVRDAEWEEAIRTGDGFVPVRVMCDSRFLIHTAMETGCWLQYTGFDNVEETRYLRRYMDAVGAGNIPFFGENSGQYDVVGNGTASFALLMENGMAGIDVTHSRWLFENHDGKTPVSCIDAFKENMRLFREYLHSGSAG